LVVVALAHRRLGPSSSDDLDPGAAAAVHGAHDLRQTYATWLEDAGIPARVIDELMGHQASRRGGHLGGSAIGAHYRHITPEMAARVVDAIQQRLMVVLGVAEGRSSVTQTGQR
jgi:integrase